MKKTPVTPKGILGKKGRGRKRSALPEALDPPEPSKKDKKSRKNTHPPKTSTPAAAAGTDGNEISLKAPSSAHILLPVCARHERAAPFSCAFCPDGGVSVCNARFCEICLHERHEVYQKMGMDSVISKMSCYLCPFHFEHETEKCWFSLKELTPIKYAGIVKISMFFCN